MMAVLFLILSCRPDDLIDAFVLLMDSEDGFTGPVNLGNPGEFTIKELAEIIVDLTNSKSELVYKPLPSDDPMQRQPDISLAKEKLNWEPRVGLKEGLEKTIPYFDHVLREWID
jgi:UDP-glucuronate decarboxylase